MNDLLRNPLVLVIDMQNVYDNGQKWECKNFRRALDIIPKIIEKFPHNVIFTRHVAAENALGVWNDYNRENAEVNSDEWLCAIHNDLKDSLAEYKCYDKVVYSAYSVENVQKAAANASCVIVTGVVAECCVLSTVFDLINAGRYVLYVKDAIAGIDDETEAATIKVLEGLAPLHLRIVTTAELEKEYMD